MGNKKFIYLMDKHMCSFGYGTGEIHVINTLKAFFGLLENNRSYDYQILENNLGPQTTWLLIELLGRADWIEYGTSSRFGWICDDGELIREFFSDKTPQELYEIVSNISCDEKNDIIDEFNQS